MIVYLKGKGQSCLSILKPFGEILKILLANSIVRREFDEELGRWEVELRNRSH